MTPETRDVGQVEPLDARLVVPALATWLAAFVGTGARSLVAVLLAAAAVTLSLWFGRRRAWTALAVMLCLSGGLLVGALRVGALERGPVHELGLARAVMAGTGTVTADPRRTAPAVRGVRRTDALVVVPVRLEQVTARGRTARVRSPVLVLARDPGWMRLLPGQRLGLRGRLGPSRVGEPFAAVLLATAPPQERGRPPPLQRAAGSLREGLHAASAQLPPAERGLLPGLVLGDTSGVSAGLARDFRTAGLTHLTAVSGANLAIVTGFVLLAGRYAGLRGRALPVVAGLAMVGFVVLARPQPSVLRAAAMGGVALVALATGRRRRSLAALGATVVVLLLLDPWLARSYGFVLSVVATGALVLLAPRWAATWHRRGAPLALAQALAVPLAAQLACGPVVALLSDQVSLVAVPANVLVAPAVPPATVLGVMATLASAVPGPYAGWFAQLAGWCVAWVVAVAQHAAATPYAAIAWPGSVAGAAALACISVAAVLGARELVRRPRVGLLVVVLLVVDVAVPISQPGWPPQGWVVAACDVGQGDALVLSIGHGAGVVVDAGPDPPAVDRCLRRLGVDVVPAVVLTHLHADHVEGLPGVLRGRRVGEVLLGPLGEPADELGRVTRWARTAGVRLTRAVVGDRASIGDLAWEVVWPQRVIEAGSVPNNSSTVLLVTVSGVRILLTGDVEAEAQQAILAGGRIRPVDVLKVAHHGSANQSGDLVLAARPRVALVSVGADNDYGHPAAPTIRALRAVGAVIGRTDRDGTLVVCGPSRSLRLVTTGR